MIAQRSIVTSLVLTVGCMGQVDDGAFSSADDALRQGECWVEPASPVVGSNYLIRATGLHSDRDAKVEVQDASGTRVFDLLTDGAGELSQSALSSQEGAAQVFISVLIGRAFREVAACNYAVISAQACGDGTCSGGAGEDCESCSSDCGSCPEPMPTCGDGSCDSDVGEDCNTCSADCGSCPEPMPTCGDSSCDSDVGEDCNSCSADCGSCPVSSGSSLTQDYGCRCDGSSDDSSCIQAALDDYRNWKNRTLSFPAGATCIGYQLDWSNANGSSSSRYVLQGNNATIKAPNGAPTTAGNWILMVDNGSWLLMDSLHFDGNRQNRAAQEMMNHNLVISSVEDMDLVNVHSNNGCNDNLYIKGETNAGSNKAEYSKRITVRDPIMRNAFRNNISVINCDECLIVGDGNGRNSSCQLTDAHGTMPEAGIDFEPNPTSAIPGISNSGVQGCYIARNGGRCVQTSPAGSSVGTFVRDNFIEDCRRDTLGCGAGVHGGHSDMRVEGNTLVNFQLSNTCRSLIDFPSTDGSGTSIVRNNEIRNISGVPDPGGIIYIHRYHGGSVTFEDNQMSNIGVSASGDWCGGSGTKTVRDNTVDGVTQSPNPGCP